MTAQQLALRLAKYLGIVSFDPADASNTSNPLRPGLHASDVADIVECINAALQEIRHVEPVAVNYKHVGDYLRAPVGITLDATQGSAAVVLHGYEAWMDGCGVKVGSDLVHNEIVNATTLRWPYLGASASGVAATVYQNCLTPDASVINITGPVEIPQVRLLEFAGARSEFYRYEQNRIGGDDYGRLWTKLYATARIPAQPIAYFVDTEQTADRLAIRLRFLPVPDVQYAVAYGASSNSKVITVADIGTADDPGTTFGMPGGWDASVLLPMALKRFTALAAVNLDGVKAGEIDRQHKMARSILQRANPNRASVHLVPTFR